MLLGHQADINVGDQTYTADDNLDVVRLRDSGNNLYRNTSVPVLLTYSTTIPTTLQTMQALSQRCEGFPPYQFDAVTEGNDRCVSGVCNFVYEDFDTDVQFSRNVKNISFAQEKMRAILLLLLALSCLASAKSLNVTLQDYTVTDDNSLLCGTDLSNTLVVFSATNDLVVQNLTTGASSSSISGDGQWIVVIQNETMTIYIRKAQSWSIFTSVPIPFNQTSLSSLFFDTTGSRLILVTDDETYFYSKSSTSKDYTSWSQLVQSDSRQVSFSKDLSTAFEKINSSLLVSTVDWTNKKMNESTKIADLDQGGYFVAVNSAGTAFVYGDSNNRLYRKSSGGWIAQDVGDFYDICGFSGDDQFLFRITNRGELSRYLVGDVTRAQLPRQVLSSNGEDQGWYVHPNYDGSQVIYDTQVINQSNAISPIQLTIPSTLHQAGQICQNDTWCQSDLRCGPGHYCHQPNRTAQPDSYTAYFKDLWHPSGDVVLQFKFPALVTCNVAGSTPVGVEAAAHNAYNNTKLQVVYHNSTGLSRMVDAGYLKVGLNSLRVEPLEMENRTVEFWLSCVCVDDYASSAPTIFSLEIPVATSSTQSGTQSSTQSSTQSDIYTAQPTHLDSPAAVIGITTTLVASFSRRFLNVTATYNAAVEAAAVSYLFLLCGKLG
ncbi:hypothetical protein PROFUN_08789 [Planoprotostelium fungivorum]|uniref:Uncharacterized protein n=1 Tax=Planoprotostelium fungivorum TaxID=1890364 RepID=A0A2P6MVR5_9EUKA|nr:hypothetical protein PROFUN_08789 [Planoprotostelium fungivorum]